MCTYLTEKVPVSGSGKGAARALDKAIQATLDSVPPGLL